MGHVIAWNADDIGWTPDDYRELRWQYERHMLGQRWKALRTLWGPPVVNEWATGRRKDGVTVYQANRDDDWTFWRAVKATIGIVLGRHWTEDAAECWKSGHVFSAYGKGVAFWDSRSVYGGYDVDCCWLYPRCRVSIFSDGESNL